jgi:outer membrane protein OmpA-like peptidoglycan-associated protein
MKYLIDKGVEASRLEPVGYGETRPTVPNTTKANKEKNRRVEFAIVEVDGKPVEKTIEVKTPAP